MRDMRDMNNGWDTGLEFLSSCGRCDKNFEILIDPVVRSKIGILMEKKRGIEWLCFLLGEIDNNTKTVYVDDLHIPDSQSVTMSNVNEIQCNDEVRKSTIGVIHSHNAMGCFFSNDDWEYLNKNHDVSIVVSNKNGPLEFLAVVRDKTPCGAYIHKEASVSLNLHLDADLKNSFEEEIDIKIKYGIREFQQPGIPGFTRVQDGNVVRYVPNKNIPMHPDAFDEEFEDYMDAISKYPFQ